MNGDVVKGAAGGAAASTATWWLIELPEWAQPFADRLAVELGIAGVAVSVMLAGLGWWAVWRMKRYDELATAFSDASTATALALEKGANATASSALAIKEVQTISAQNSRSLDDVIHKLELLDRSLGAGAPDAR